MSLIRKPHELNVQSKIKALIYGQSGTGKSTMALSAPKPLLFDFDGGIHRVNIDHMNNAGTVQVSSYKDFLDVLNNEDLSAYETIVIDTGGKCLDYMAEYIIKNNPKMGKANGTLTLQGYGERKAEFTALCKRVSMMDKHIVFVAHRETRQDGDDMRYVPLFGGSNYDSLVTELDIVGYIETNGRKRIITFDPTSRNDGKNTCNLPAVIEIPIIADEQGNTKPNTFFNDYVIGAYNKRLEQRAALSKDFNVLMTSIREQIELITDAQAANDFIGRIDAFNHLGSSKLQAAMLLSTQTKKLGLTLNKTTKQYEPAA